MNATRSTYRDHSITTTWCELSPYEALTAQARFEACFKVHPHAPEVDSWQEFPPGVFPTREGATANALNAAERSIDLSLEAV